MCGLLGWFTTHGERRLIPLAAALMVQMDDRGGHSWGYWADGKIWKGLGDIAEGVGARSLRNASVLMAHTRLASVGAVSIANCHPFTCGNIIGAHNGGISNHWELNKKYDRKFEVDSKHIFAQLDEGKPLSELEGYGAITWIDKARPGIVNLSRFNGGVLSAARVFSKNKQFGVVWASTQDALKRSLDAAGLDRKWVNIENDRFYEVRDGDIHEVVAKDGKPEINPIRSKSYSGYSNRGWDGYQYGPHMGYSYNTGAKSETEVMEDLFTSDPKLFDGLERKGGNMWYDGAGHIFTMASECAFCKDGKRKPTTYFSGLVQERLCLPCTITNDVDAWVNSSQDDDGKQEKLIEDPVTGENTTLLCVWCQTVPRQGAARYCSTDCFFEHQEDVKKHTPAL